MDDVLGRLVDILEKEYGVYSDLLELSRKKTEIIRKRRIGELEKIVGVEQQLILNLNNLERQREKIIKELEEKDKSAASGELTISFLISRAKGELKRRLEAVRDRLSEVIEEQKRLNDLNSRLIKNDLEYIRFSLNLLTGQDAAGTFYAKDGHTSVRSQKRNLFDKKV